MPAKKQDETKADETQVEKAPAAPPAKKEPTEAELLARFDGALRKMKCTVTHPIERLDDETWGVMFADSEIEAECRRLFLTYGNVVLSLIERTLGGSVSRAHVAKWTRELKKAAA